MFHNKLIILGARRQCQESYVKIEAAMTKNTFDCSRYVPKECKAYCCGPVPLKKDVYARVKHKAKRPIISEIDDGEYIMPDTKSRFCAFLSEDYQCQIYQDRPDVCKEFGNSDSPLMQCPYMTKEGRDRTPEEREKTSKEFQIAFEKMKRFL